MLRHAHLITLLETPERERHAVTQLEKYALHHEVHRFQRQFPGWKGCIDSHLKVYQQARAENLDYVFVCEDNILAASNNRLALTEAATHLERFDQQCPDWGIVFVGGYILRPWDYCTATQYPHIYETRNNNHGTVAYLIHRRLYEEILTLHQAAPINVHFDIFLSGYKCYIYNPLLFYHAPNLKSNINAHSDSWRRLWFHPQVMKIHETVFFSVPRPNRKWLYVAILLIILGGLWWVLNSRSNSSSSSPSTGGFIL